MILRANESIDDFSIIMINHQWSYLMVVIVQYCYRIKKYANLCSREGQRQRWSVFSIRLGSIELNRECLPSWGSGKWILRRAPCSRWMSVQMLWPSYQPISFNYFSSLFVNKNYLYRTTINIVPYTNTDLVYKKI